MCCGEWQRQDAAADVGDDRGSFGADGVEHGRNVGHELLERRKRGDGDRIGQAGPPLVEDDQPSEGRQPLSQRRHRWHVPPAIHMGEPLVQQQEVRWPFAEHLVGQVQLAQSRVLRLRSSRPQG